MRLWAILRQRCPVCLQGRVFRSLWGMNKVCPRCGVRFERETGFFLNSMFVAYVIGFLIALPTALFLSLRGYSAWIFLIVVTLELGLLWPLIFRYSRVIWMHADQLMDPRRPDTPLDGA